MNYLDWHRLFGLVLTDFFTNSPFAVELEKDLSLRQQFLDVIIVRKQSGNFASRLPDGFDNFGNHNLISFKSYQEALVAWTIKELVSYYVNYRKQLSPSLDQLLPEENFRLYGVCARHPRQLAAQLELRLLQAGVYECGWGTDKVRLIVLSELPQEEHNAPLHLFSAVQANVQYGQERFRRRCAATSSLIHQLLARYKQEGMPMPYTMEDYRRDLRDEVLGELTAEERLAGLSTQDFLQNLSPEKRAEILRVALQGMPKEELEKYLAEIPRSAK